jgi:hypothetical protein
VLYPGDHCCTIVPVKSKENTKGIAENPYINLLGPCRGHLIEKANPAQRTTTGALPALLFRLVSTAAVACGGIGCETARQNGPQTLREQVHISSSLVPVSAPIYKAIPSPNYLFCVDNYSAPLWRSYQKQSCWCWAACLEMILRTNGIQFTQEQIAAREFRAPLNLGCADFVIPQWLNCSFANAFGGMVRFNCSLERRPLTPNEVSVELKSHGPFIIVSCSGPTTEHDAVAYGYYLYSNGSFMLRIFDPSSGEVTKEYAEEQQQWLATYRVGQF